MRIISWNLNHRTCEKPIHPLIYEVVNTYSPECLILNEFVDGATRVEFRETLKRLGLTHFCLSQKVGCHNRIFLASREEIQTLTPAITSPQPVVNTNFLIFRVKNLVVYALRIPVFKSTSEKIVAWEYHLSTIELIQPHIVIGDFNIDPRDNNLIFFTGLNELAFRRSAVDGASFWSNNGNARSIDHIFHQPNVRADGTYLAELNGKSLVGKTKDFASDHAALFSEISLSKS